MGNLSTLLRRFVGTKQDPTRADAPTPASMSTQFDRLGVFEDDSNDFAVALYGQLRQRPGNLFFSPFSIRTALCMAQAGARGKTATQMRKALSISSSDETLQSGFSKTLRRLEAAGGGAYEMAVANSLWGQEGAPLLTEYIDGIARHYGGAMNLVDFRHAAEAARAAMNQWVEGKTRHKIRGLIPANGLDASMRLVLANAIYFKGSWVVPFEERSTREQPFYLQDGRTVQVPLMHRYENMEYLQADGYQAVELEYRGRDLSMVVLLPDRKNGLPDLERKLSAQLLRESVGQMRNREVKLFLPRFEVTWGAVLRRELTALGMPLAFTPFEADFSGINGQPPPSDDSLFLSAAFHKAFVEVNEEGTEAAAATAMMVPMSLAMAPSKPPPVPVFRADHPFLFAIRDRKSDVILFLGRMDDPTQVS